MKTLFKNGSKFFGGDGNEATEQEVAEFLEFLAAEEKKKEAQEKSSVEKITEGLVAGVSEELENAKKDLETLIEATGQTDFSGAIDAITSNKSKIIVQAEAIGILEQYISDIQTLTSTGTITDAKVAVAEAIAQAGKVRDLEQIVKHGTAENEAQIYQIGNLRDALTSANARIAELEKPAEATPSVPAELEKPTPEPTTKKGK